MASRQDVRLAAETVESLVGFVASPERLKALNAALV